MIYSNFANVYQLIISIENHMTHMSWNQVSIITPKPENVNL